ncbi:MAG: ABC transporter ATP-binding protein/permease [Candidatus Omnitrophica bacterium]|nr:ABC transporter ATP-binding protein/permease [Candidatus Omnitrophota bacterium]
MMKIQQLVKKFKGPSVLFQPFWKRCVILFFLVQIASVMESIGVALFYPLFQAMATPTIKNEHAFLSTLTSFFPARYLLFVMCCLIISLTVIKSIVVVVRTRYVHKLILDFREYWMSKIMNKYLRASFSYLFSVKQGVLLNNVLEEPRKASKTMELISTFLSKSFVLLYLYIILLFINYKVTLLLSILFIATSFIIIKTLSLYSIRIGHERIKLNQRMVATAAEGVASIRQIKTFSIEHVVSKQFADIIHTLFTLNVRFRIIQSLPTVVMEVLVVVITMGIILYLTYIRDIALVSVLPILGIFVVVGYKFFINISFLVSRGMEIVSGLPSMSLVYATVSVINELDCIGRGEKLDRITRDIYFKDVSFQYPDRLFSFENITMHIPIRKVTAIIGASGSGKSTIADLLLGFLVPQKGAIMINGRDLRDLDMLQWRKKIGFVTQETFIFHSSIKENILIGRLNATDDEVITAARQANAHDFIIELPRGYDTVVGERGMKLSGGQRQRLAIARAIIRDPELFIFDEATSSLDTESEQLIQKSIKALGQEKTVIIITHRISTIKDSDLVYRLEQGRIVAKGSFDNVLHNQE